MDPVGKPIIIPKKPFAEIAKRGPSYPGSGYPNQYPGQYPYYPPPPPDAYAQQAPPGPSLADLLAAQQAMAQPPAPPQVVYVPQPASPQPPAAPPTPAEPKPEPKDVPAAKDTPAITTDVKPPPPSDELKISPGRLALYAVGALGAGAIIVAAVAFAKSGQAPTKGTP